MTPDNGLMTITAAYTGLRWGELAGLQWSRTYLLEDPVFTWTVASGPCTRSGDGSSGPVSDPIALAA